MSDPKNRHSEARNSHISSFRLSRPVLVSRAAGAWLNSLLPSSFRCGLRRPAVDAEHEDGGAHGDDGGGVDQANSDDREADGGDKREEGRRGHVYAVAFALSVLFLRRYMSAPRHHRHGPP